MPKVSQLPTLQNVRKVDSIPVLQNGTLGKASWSNWRRQVHIDDFNVIGDGVQDDSSAFNAAIADLADGGVLHLGRSSYKINVTGNGFMLPSNVTIRGEGNATRILMDAPGASSGTVRGLFVVSGTQIRLENLWIQRVGNFIGVMVFLGDSSYITFRDVIFDGQMTQIGSDSLCHGVKYGNDGGTPNSIKHIVWDNCDFRELDFGFFMSNPSTSQVSNLKIRGCRFERLYGDGVNLNAPNGTLTDVIISDCDFLDGLSTNPGGGFPIDVANGQRVSIRGCNFRNMPYEAIHCEDRSKDITISACNFSKCAQLDFSVIQLINQVFRTTIQGCTFDQTEVSLTTQQLSARGSAHCLYIGTGGAYPTAGSVVFQGNSLALGDSFGGIEGFSAPWVLAQGNYFEGTGSVASGSYTGGSNVGISTTNGGPVLTAHNMFRGLLSAMPSTTNNFPAPAGSGLVQGNFIADCETGIGAQPTGNVGIMQNVMSNCVHPLAVGSNGVTFANSAVVTLNYATGCANPMDINADGFWSSANNNTGPSRFLQFNCDDASLARGGWPVRGYETTPDFIYFGSFSHLTAPNGTIFSSTEASGVVIKDGSGAVKGINTTTL